MKTTHFTYFRCKHFIRFFFSFKPIAFSHYMTRFLKQPVQVWTHFSFISRPTRRPTIELLNQFKEKRKRRGEMLPDWDAGAAVGLKHGAEEHELQRHESEQLCRQERRHSWDTREHLFQTSAVYMSMTGDSTNLHCVWSRWFSDLCLHINEFRDTFARAHGWMQLQHFSVQSMTQQPLSSLNGPTFHHHHCMEIFWKNQKALFHSRQEITGGTIYFVKDGSLQFAPTKKPQKPLIAAFKSQCYENKLTKEIQNVMRERALILAWLLVL